VTLMVHIARKILKKIEQIKN